MDWQNIITFVLSFVGGSAILTGAIVYIIKNLAKSYFDKDLERYKLELGKESTEHRTKFEILHKERAEVIKQTYQYLVDVCEDFTSLMCPLQLTGEPTVEEKTKKASESFNTFLRYFERNKVFFENNIAEDIDNFIKRLKTIWHEFNTYEYKAGQKPFRAVDKWNNAWERLTKEEIPELRKGLEKKFRSIIGIIQD